jgi:PilZ domain
MTSDMAFECLLVSHDPAVCSTFTRVLSDFSVQSDHCLTSSKAPQLLAKGSHDLIVIDWEGQASLEALEEIQRMKRKPTVMAISAEDCPLPGVHVALRKPVTRECAKAYFRVAYSRMLIDHRRRARYALMTSVVAYDEKKRRIPLTVTDIGEGGIGVSSKEKLAVGDVLFLNLTIASDEKPLCLEARVLRTREYGAAGCEFVRMSPADRDTLREWLRQKMPIKKPANTD